MSWPPASQHLDASCAELLCSSVALLSLALLESALTGIDRKNLECLSVTPGGSA